MKLNLLKCVVRMEDKTPIIVMESEVNGIYECFTFKDGHNEMSLDLLCAFHDGRLNVRNI